ncbi:MAG: DNA polymerase III subunit beta [Clostridia bacterium]|nr:DNA polymerase III subunit beta [Clostridia bacterium]
MKFTVNTNELNEGVAVAIRALSPNRIMPILDGVYIRAEGDSLTIVCTDLSLRIEAVIPALVEVAGEAVIPGKLFADISRRMPGGELAFETHRNSVVLTSGLVKTTLQMTPAADYPRPPVVDSESRISIGGALLKRMIRQCAFATAQDDSKPMLTGVLFDSKDGVLEMVALDGFRLAIRREAVESSFESKSVVVPVKSLNEFARIIDDEQVQLVLSDSHALIDLGHTRMYTRLIESKFIKYDHILSNDYKTRVRLNRAELLDAVERAALMTRDSGTGDVNMSFDEYSLRITASSQMGGIDENHSVEVIGNPIEIAFKARYLIDVLRNLDDEELLFDMTTSVGQCVIRPIEGDSYYYLVMPVRTR